MGVLTCREYCFFLVVRLCFSVVFFFFKQKTAYEVHISDWSSDVCSSDLVLVAVVAGHQQRRRTVAVADHRDRNPDRAPGAVVAGMRHDQRPEALAVGVQVDGRPDLRGSVDAHSRRLARSAMSVNRQVARSEEHTSELQALMSIS